MQGDAYLPDLSPSRLTNFQGVSLRNSHNRNAGEMLLCLSLKSEPDCSTVYKQGDALAPVQWKIRFGPFRSMFPVYWRRRDLLRSWQLQQMFWPAVENTSLRPLGWQRRAAIFWHKVKDLNLSNTRYVVILMLYTCETTVYLRTRTHLRQERNLFKNNSKCEITYCCKVNLLNCVTLLRALAPLSPLTSLRLQGKFSMDIFNHFSILSWVKLISWQYVWESLGQVGNRKK